VNLPIYKFRFKHLALPLILLLTLMLNACSANPTAIPPVTTTAPTTTVPTTAAIPPTVPATPTSPVAISPVTSGQPPPSLTAPNATAAISPTVAGTPVSPVSGTVTPRTTTTPNITPGTSFAVYSELSVPKPFADLITASLPIKNAKNPQVRFFVSSEADPALGASALDAEFKRQGYKFALPGNTKPTATNNTYTGVYSKDATSPEVLVSVSTIETANFNKVTEAALVQLGATQTEARRFVDGVRGAKTLAIFVYALDLVTSLGS
jgi:hypothetical protein